jgi:hypothetical protein
MSKESLHRALLFGAETSRCARHQAGSRALPLYAVQVAERLKTYGRFRFAALLLSATYIALLCIYFSNRRLMWGDEFIGWFLITDPSWRHALGSWNQAADSGGPLFYLIGRSLVFVGGPHPVVLRLFSAGCLWLSSALWFDLLRRKFSPAPALLSCALIWLCDYWYLYYLGEVRFYGQLVLAVTIAAVAMVWIEDRKPRPAICFAAMFVAGSLLIGSHMLGVVYGACFVTALTLSRLPWRKRVGAIGGTVGSWSLILLFRTALKMGADAYTWVSMPHVSDLVRFHLHTPVYLESISTLSTVINLLLGAIVLTGAVLAFRKQATAPAVDPGRRLLLIFSGVLLLLPTGFFVVSHLYKPIWVGRYMMPYDLGLAGCLCGALWIIGLQPWSSWMVRKPMFAAACIVVLILHVCSVRQQPSMPRSDIEPYLSSNTSLPLVLQDPDLFMQARWYGGNEGSQVYFVLPQLEYTTFDAVLKRGYQPGLAYDKDFFPAHPVFLYLDIPKAHAYFFEREQAMHPAWHVTHAGSLLYYGAVTPLLKVEQ